jgi:hypothetical protein
MLQVPLVSAMEKGASRRNCEPRSSPGHLGLFIRKLQMVQTLVERSHISIVSIAGIHPIG